MREGDVLLVALPQSDGAIKRRPSIALRQLPPFNDWLLCGISTQLQQRVPFFDEVVLSTDDDFKSSGLKAPSLIRLGYLFVLPAARTTDVIGFISVVRHRKLLTNLRDFLQPGSDSSE